VNKRTVPPRLLQKAKPPSVDCPNTPTTTKCRRCRMHGGHRNLYLDEPNHPVPRTRDMPARGGEEHPTAMCPIYHDRSGPVSEGILDTAPKMPHQGTISIRVARDSRWSVRQPLGGSNNGSQSHPSRILLVHRSQRLRGICQEVPKMSRIWLALSPETGRATQHDITLVVRHLGNGHHRPILTRQRPNEAPASR